MLTVAVELSRALAANCSGDQLVLLCSRERPDSLRDVDCEAVLSPYRHELVMKSRWLPAVEPQLESDAILYPYWPSPPFRRAGAPPTAIFVHDLAFRIRQDEVPWQQRMYFRFVLPIALRQAAAVLVPSESTRRDLLEWYRIPGLEQKVEVIPEGPPQEMIPGPLPDGIEPGFILAVGTVEPRKNYPRLLAAYRQLRGGRHGALPMRGCARSWARKAGAGPRATPGRTRRSAPSTSCAASAIQKKGRRRSEGFRSGGTRSGGP